MNYAAALQSKTAANSEWTFKFKRNVKIGRHREAKTSATQQITRHQRELRYGVKTLA